MSLLDIEDVQIVHISPGKGAAKDEELTVNRSTTVAISRRREVAGRMHLLPDKAHAMTVQEVLAEVTAVGSGSTEIFLFVVARGGAERGGRCFVGGRGGKGGVDR
jgi:hypothetical protein